MTTKEAPKAARRLSEVLAESNAGVLLEEIEGTEQTITTVKITTETGVRGPWRKATIGFADGTMLSTGAGAIVAKLGDLTEDDLPVIVTFTHKPSPNDPSRSYWDVE